MAAEAHAHDEVECTRHSSVYFETKDGKMDSEQIDTKNVLGITMKDFMHIWFACGIE